MRRIPKIIFITGASHEKYMVNLNHFQRIYFLSRFTELTIISSKKSKFIQSAKINTKIINAKIKGKLGVFITAIIHAVKNRKRNKYDIVITEPSMLCVSGYFFKLLNPVIWVVDVWDIPIRQYAKSRIIKAETKIKKLVLKKCFEFTDFFILSIIPNFEFAWFNIPKQKLLLLQNAIWITDTNKVHRPFQNVKNSIILCMRTKYTKYCGLDTLTQAYQMLSREIQNVNLKIIGQIPRNLSYQANDIKNYSNVQFHEFMEHDKLLEEIRKATICVVPFKNVPDLAQTYPIKILEYLSEGAVVVASDIEGIKRTITDGYNGILFKSGNSVDLKEKLKLILNDPILRKNISQNANKIKSNL